ncbi:MAG: hypothetical protein JNM93_01880 [Bacteriovoracaceae bacterium]|nr:hypothetical protein [Bacteriovoracaceae bacterium]
MKISGFTFIRNADKLYIPVKESILSILPLVDEFVIAMGENDADDKTEELIRSINSPKIKIVNTIWPKEKYAKNTIYAQQTDVAKEACTGDWLFYLQGDEAIHENDLSQIRAACEKYHTDTEVEGFLFKYRHFWGDYEHYQISHGWYPREIRIIRNLPKIHSWRDAQSFRYYEGAFNATQEDYLTKEGNRKLKVVELDVYVYHYGWVRPPEKLKIKRIQSTGTYHGKGSTQQQDIITSNFDYGPLSMVGTFKATHPKTMTQWMKKIHWKHELQMTGKPSKDRTPHKHERLKYKILTFIEQNIIHRPMGEFKNYKKLCRK